jgi:hypothetical protein
LLKGSDGRILIAAVKAIDPVSGDRTPPVWRQTPFVDPGQ